MASPEMMTTTAKARSAPYRLACRMSSRQSTSRTTLSPYMRGTFLHRNFRWRFSSIAKSATKVTSSTPMMVCVDALTSVGERSSELCRVSIRSLPFPVGQAVIGKYPALPQLFRQEQLVTRVGRENTDRAYAICFERSRDFLEHDVEHRGRQRRRHGRVLHRARWVLKIQADSLRWPPVARLQGLGLGRTGVLRAQARYVRGKGNLEERFVAFARVRWRGDGISSVGEQCTVLRGRFTQDGDPSHGNLEQRAEHVSLNALEHVVRVHGGVIRHVGIALLEQLLHRTGH